MQIRNLLGQIPPAQGREILETLLETAGARLERIISYGQASPDGVWYDQAEHEWLMVLAGSAGLHIEGEREIVVLRAGDSLNIPAHRRHRVEWTSTQQPTIWLALYYRDAV